ncbi:MAG TPA: cyclic nucleotide-binding domain-containing protein [Methylocystis sp.]
MMLDDDIDNLRRIPLFSIFEPNALRMLALSAETRLLRADDVLFRRGEMSDGGYVLTTGSLALAADGRPQAMLVRPWTLIGETALLAPSTRPAAAIALEPAAAIKILRPLFHLILEQHPATAARVRDFFRRRLLDFIHDVSVEASTSDIDVGRLT